MQAVKNILKTTLPKAAGLASGQSKMSADEARDILTDCSPRPIGTCMAENHEDIAYDLQIIVPVYNQEKHLQECIDSVCTQTTRYKCLATFVDDGSTDGSAHMLEQLPTSFGNIDIEVISQENRGLAGARNAGMKTLRGEYITFLDSDDTLADGCIDKMLDAANRLGADIVQGGMYSFDDKGSSVIETAAEGLSEDGGRNLLGFACGKLYRYPVLRHFRFPEGYWFEDTPISFMLCAMQYKCAIVKDIMYGYRSNPEGITSKAMHSKKSVDSYWITEECLEEFPAFGLPYDQRAYEYLLRQSIINEKRAFFLFRGVREAQFVLLAELMKRYFDGFETKEPSMKALEEALNTRRFTRFELLAAGMF